MTEGRRAIAFGLLGCVFVAALGVAAAARSEWDLVALGAGAEAVLLVITARWIRWYR